MKKYFIFLVFVTIITNNYSEKVKEVKFENDLTIENYLKLLVPNDEIYNAIIKHSKLNDIDPVFLTALIWTESRFNVNARNHFNKNGTIDRGLCQLNSKTFKNLKEEDFFNIDKNIENGAQYLAFCLKNGGGSRNALICYNAGIGNFKKGFTPDSTKKYIEKVMSFNNEIYNNINNIRNNNASISYI